MKKICLISPLLYRYIYDKIIPGGAELQILLLARNLSKIEHYQIILLVAGEKKEPYKFENFTVYEYDESKGLIPFFHFFYKLSVKYLKILKIINADIYLQRGAGAITGLTAFYCEKYKKRMFFLIASIRDVDKSTFLNFRDLIIYRYGIKHVAKVIAQTNEQKIILKNNFNLEAQVIKNLVVFDNNPFIEIDKQYFLWVGRLNSEKQPYAFLKIIKELPNFRFIAVGSAVTSYAEEAKKEFCKVKNLEYRGEVGRDQILKLFSKAVALINTSDHEGFSNTWLEAWYSKIPVISLNVNPDSILTKYKLGLHSKTIEQMIEDIKTLNNNPQLRNELGENGWNYLQENHSVEAIMKKYCELIDNV
ncbi:glycosyltransferase family 4 protein [bacterium]|nr:glycosyltransferase family 4 protein [bacterium]